MDLPTLDLLLRGATFALATAAAATLVARGARTWETGLAAFCVAGLAAFALSSMRGGIDRIGFAVFAFDAWCMATPAALWMLSGTLFRDTFRPGPWHLLALGASVAPTFAGDWGRFALGPLANFTELSQGLLLAGRGAALAFLGSACWFALAHWRDDLVEPRRHARAAFVAVIVAEFAALAGSDFVFGGRGAPPLMLAVGHAALVVLTFAILVAAARGALDEVLAGPPGGGGRELAAVAAGRATPAPRPVLAASRSGGAEIALARRVVEAMQAKRLWKREGLGIAALAKELGSQEYLVRRAINRHLGYRNFNDFLHDYRLGEAERRLADPAEGHLPVLTIALDCGYGSIGPFNRAFKARFGLTPSQFRALRAGGMAAPEIGQLSR